MTEAGAVQVLRQQAAVLREFLTLSVDMRQALVRHDVSAMKDLFNRLETRRQEFRILQEASRAAPRTGEDAELAELAEARLQVRTVVEKLAAAQLVNTALLARSAQRTEDMLELLGSALAPTYLPDGKAPGPDPAPRLFEEA